MQKINNSFDTKVKKWLDLGILVAKSDELQYAKKHNLKLTRFENGAIYISGLCVRSDVKKCEFEINFLAGSRYNPKGKDGLAHLLEHLFSDENFEDFFAAKQVYINAATSPQFVRFECNGNLNFDYPNYAVPAALEKAFTIVDTIGQISNDSVYNSNISTIKNEIENYLSNFERITAKSFYDLIFDEASNWRIQNLGTKDSLDGITQSDVIDYHKKYFGPKNMVVATYVESDMNQFDLLNKKISGLIEKIEKPVELTERGTAMYNVPNEAELFNTGKVVKVSTDIKKDLIKTFAYIKLNGLSEIDKKAVDIVFTVLSQKIFNVSRVLGLSYRISSDYILTANDDFIFMVTSIDGSTDWDSKFVAFKEFLEKLLSESEKYKDLFILELETEKIRQQAVPISSSSILSHARLGLMTYGYMYDADVDRELFHKVTLDNIESILNGIKVLKPNYFCMGDFI